MASLVIVDLSVCLAHPDAITPDCGTTRISRFISILINVSKRDEIGNMPEIGRVIGEQEDIEEKKKSAVVQDLAYITNIDTVPSMFNRGS